MQNMNTLVNVQGKILCGGKIFYLRCDLKLTLTLTGSLTVALGLGLSPGKTISVENLKPNAKHEYHRKRTGKMFKRCVDEKLFIFDLTSS